MYYAMPQKFTGALLLLLLVAAGNAQRMKKDSLSVFNEFVQIGIAHWQQQ